MISDRTGPDGFTATPEEKKNALLEVKHLYVDYVTGEQPVRAVNDVSFTLRRGQIMGLAGESGSGKSTLSHAITRLLQFPARVSSGEVWYYPRKDGASESQFVRSLRKKNGQVEGVRESEAFNVLDLSSEELRAFRWRDLAIVFQSAMNALNPAARIEAQIVDVLRAHNPQMKREERHQRALELFRLVGIAPDRLRSYPHELSGGMRQRAVIAIALALQPEIIIMDEPTTALDVVVQRDILVELMRLRELLDFSVIFITHDLSLLLEVADQVSIMYAGRIVESASWEELYRHPRHPYTYGLLHSFPSLHGPRERMRGIPGSPPDLRNLPKGCAFNPRCPHVFDMCFERLPALKIPERAGLHISAQGLEPDEQAVSRVLPMRSQRAQVACHLYSAEHLRVDEEQVSGRTSGKGEVINER